MQYVEVKMSWERILLLCVTGWLIGTIQGRASIYWTTPRYGSLAGGTKVEVHGTGFSTDSYTTYNVILLGQTPCIVRHYTSSPKRLECVTEPYPGAEEGRSYPSLQASLITNSVLTSSTGSNKRFTYHWAHTPQLQSVLPKSGPLFSVIAMGGSRLSSDYNRYESVRLGASICETRNQTTDQHYGKAWYNSLFHVRCRPTQQRTGAVNASLILSGSSGRTWNHSQSLYPMHDWSLGMYELFPDIHGISPHMGSVEGGCLVTVTGTGFAADSLEDIAVDIDGIPCQVISSIPTEIKCWAGTPAEDSPAIADLSMAYPRTEEGFRFRGSRGVSYLQYDGVASLAALRSSMNYPDQPDYLAVYPSFSTTPTRLSRQNNYGARFAAFFNPHSSGNHTFYLTNDDSAEAFLSSDRNISNIRRIISSLSPTGFTNFFRYSGQKSEVFNLDRDEDSLLVAEYKEYGGQDYLQVGVHIHENDFTYKETRQVVRERQRVELYSAGLPEVQTLEVSIDSAVLGAADAPSMVVSWGGRQTPPLSTLELGNLNGSIMQLFSGMCEDAFGQELGFFHFNDVYQFEGGSGQAWTAWDGTPPVITTEDAFCGRHSLYVQDSRGRAPYPTESDSIRVSDHPYLCLAYRLPQDHSMALAVRIRGVGWHSLPLSANPQAPFHTLPSFWSFSESSSSVIDDDRWHFACTDLQTMLETHVSLPEDPEAEEGTVQSYIVEGFGVYSEIDGLRRGFYVDEVSFSSERREFDMQEYVAPARPNGIPIHSVDMSVEQTNTSNVVTSSYSLTFVPATCESSLPLLTVSLVDGDQANSGVSVAVTRTQAASVPVSGHYALSLDGHTTAPLPFHAPPQQIKEALESLEGVGEVTVFSPQHLPHDTLSRFCPGRSYQVQFEDIGRDLPLMEVTGVGLTGDQLRLSVRETMAGGLFLRPIPGHMLQTAEVTPQVHVRIRGQLSACSGGNALYENIHRSQYLDYCSFKYGPAATPTVTSMTPQTASGGDSVTISGTGFSVEPSENYVIFDDVECEVTASTESSLSCTLGSSFASSKLLHIHVLYSGVAQTNGIVLNYELALTSVNPARGSQGGGTEITITGGGFYFSNAERGGGSPPSLQSEAAASFTAASSCSGGWRNQVLLGGNPCTIVNSSSSSLRVVTPAESTLTPAMKDIQVSVVCQDEPSRSSNTGTLSSAFTYDDTITPTITGLVPASGSITGGQDITISGTGFGAAVEDNMVMFGDEECAIFMASVTELQCTSPPHSEGMVSVQVIVAGKGSAASSLLYTYAGPSITAISHCSGSLFGGQALTITGVGFGMDMDSVSVSLGERPCDVVGVEDTSIVCTTSPVTSIHRINNNAFNEDYGLGYSWNPSSVTIHVGDTVEWSWTGTRFTTRRNVVQVSGPEATVYDGSGFRSDPSVTGTFRHTFSKAGLYHYISEGHAHLGFRGVVAVVELEDISASLSIGFGPNLIPFELSGMSITCTESGASYQDYVYSTAATPLLRSVSRRSAVPGDQVSLELVGISSSQDDNLFAFGNSHIGCLSTTPPLLPAAVTPPLHTSSPTMGMYGTYMVVCTLPASLSPGVYRPLLHVAGRGWGYSVAEDTALYVHPRIVGSPSVSSGSLRGGLRMQLQTRGLAQSDVGKARIDIGSTPCAVESIDAQGQLTCLTSPALDDGYSSLIERQDPVAYWPLQADYYSTVDGSVASSDGPSFFRSFGLISVQANASIHGSIIARQAGISGNGVTDQSIQFSGSAFLRAPGRPEFVDSRVFSLEFWMKVPTSTPHYRVVVNASSTCNGSPCGFLVVLNPCNSVEFWVAAGIDLASSGSGQDGVTSGSEQGNITSNITSGSGQSDDSLECFVIHDTSQCPSTCAGRLHSSGIPLVPSGWWQVVRTGVTDWSGWGHVYVSWQPDDLSLANSDVNLMSAVGTQVLGVNGDLVSQEQTFFISSAPMELGGCSALPLGSTTPRDGLAPFSGFLDEVVYYDKPLSEEAIRSHVTYGGGEAQPIWLSVEGVDGVGEGSPPNVQFPAPAQEHEEVRVDWEAAVNVSSTYNNSVLLVMEWTGIHGIRQVSPEVFDSCDLEADYIQQWTPNMRGGRVSIPLDHGAVYHFIDSVAGGCVAGRKLKIQSGSVHVIDWRVGVHDDITIPVGVGLLFHWSGSYHNVLEMSIPVNQDCTFVNQNAEVLGQVRHGWSRDPSLSGEVLVSGLSVGLHHFACSVGDHCLQGMRFTVTVEGRTGSQELAQTSMRGVVHRVQWLVQEYEDLIITDGDSVEFTWGGFHSLHQVTEEVYRSCGSDMEPLHVWRDSSVDQTVTVEHLTPGRYYFICSVAGHCSAGMKVKVTVLPAIGIEALTHPIHADCAEGVDCSFTYGSDAANTPQLAAVMPLQVNSGSVLTLRGMGLTPPNTVPGNVADNVQVWLGHAQCIIDSVVVGSMGLEDTINCTVPNYESNYYHVDVPVQGKGFASVRGTSLIPGPIRSSGQADSASPYPTVFIGASVTSITPEAGSVLGGSELVITGSGFSHVPSKNTVSLGTIPCQVTSVTPSEMRCITGPSMSSTSDSTVDVMVSVNGLTNSSGPQYLYSIAATPLITSISDSEVNGDEVITIYGSMFDADLSVAIVSSIAEPYTVDSECVVESNSSFSAITCRLPVMAAGVYRVRVLVEGHGLARPDPSDAATLQYSLDLAEFSPTEAGNGGGVVLVVQGQGFPSGADTGTLRVSVCDVLCSVLTSTFTELTCLLAPSHAPTPIRTCNVTVESNSVSATANGTFTFIQSLTPSIASISPALGGTAGGTTVTITGSGFLPTGVLSAADLRTGDIEVTIDGAVCEWEGLVVTDMEITCRTGSHRTTLQAPVTVLVRGKGRGHTEEGLVFEYVDLWSSPFTWGGEAPPGPGDSVYIRPGQTVFLDISPPVLNLILVEGALVFYDQLDLHLQAKYIFINNGTFQVGTEETPFQHRATITLHGNISDPEIPIYGAKVLAVRQGRLELHGRPRHVTWTRLSQTAHANATNLVLQQPVDWVPGDRLVLAPTGKNGNETEEVEVLSVSGDGRSVELTRPVEFTHHGITEQFEGGRSIEIRAEVGLLSHSVVVEGALQPDPQGTLGPGADQYGVQIFIHRMGPNIAPVRIEHVEVRNSGQAFRLGRYSIHFHLTGEMNGSYVRHCSIHHSFNRAITAHGVHQLLIQGNVAYNIMGHAYFVEDGIETENRYLYNLGVLTRGSSSLLNTDQIPATFWITNPQNTFIGNAAAASRAYGFWYDLDNFPSGASFTRSVCPNKAPFGEFFNNTAHTCNEFGLRIWESYIPYVDGCQASEVGVAILRDFTSYGNGIHGVELSVVGHVQLVDFKLADNVENGIEIQETIGEWGGPAIMDTLVVSHTSVNGGPPQTGGIKTPNTPHLTVSNVTFANFDSSTTSCLRACSHCKFRQGGFQVHFQQLSFIGGSEQHKTAFQWEFEVLYRDLDGTLTGLPGGGWALPDSPLMPHQHCSMSVPAFSGSSPSHSGATCTSNATFLRMAWNQAEPRTTLQGVDMNVTNEFGMTVVPWRHYRLTHMDGYMLTLPQGYKHDLIWRLSLTRRVDTTSYSAGVYGVRADSRLWVSHALVMLPDHVNVGNNIMATSHGESPLPDEENFSWSIDNETSHVTYLISGANLTGPDNNISFTYSYEPCPPQGCPPPAIDYGPYESRQRRWSEPDSWPSGRVPEQGEDVTISSRWRMLVDVSPPPLGSVYVFGELMFEDSRDYNFTAHLILIQGPNSHMVIGTERSPFTHQLQLTLTGRRSDRPLVLGRRLILGSKAIGVFGNLSVHGVRRSSTWTRLTGSVMAGQSVLQLSRAAIADWRAGDEVVVAPSGYDPTQSEVRTIANINGGTLTLSEPLQYDHLVHRFLDPSDLTMADPPTTVTGMPPWWGDGGSMAPEVGLLSRNVVIQGGEEADEPLEVHHYGCRIFVGQYTSRGYTFSGNLWMDSVEVRYCGQGGYFSPRDPRYSIAFRDNSGRSSGNYVRRSSIHHGYNTAIGIHTSNEVEVSRNVIWRTTDSSIKAGGNGNEVRDNLAMMTNTVQPNDPPDSHAVDFPATFEVDGGNVVRGNAAAGSTRQAFEYGGEMCQEDGTNPTGNQALFWGNTAHSGLIGLNVLGLPEPCTAVGGFSAMFHWNYGVFSSTASSLTVTRLRVAVGKVGLNLNVFGPNPVAHFLGNKSVTISDSLIVGSLPGEPCTSRAPDFRVKGGVSFKADDHKLGIMMSSFNQRRSKMDGTGAWHLMKGYPVIDGVVNMHQVSFARFTTNHSCSYGMYAVANNPESPDAVHPLHLMGTNKYNVDLDALAFFYEPDPYWIVQEDCVDMDCDGPKHALVRDIDGRFTSTAPVQGSIIPVAELRFSNYSSRLPSTWLAAEGSQYNLVLATPEQVVDHMGIARGLTGNLSSLSGGGCVYVSSWQGYRCAGLQHHMLVIESMDGDSETRRLSPLALNGGNTGAGDYTDLLNGPMDHGWCTYYTCLKRLSTFFSLVVVGSDYCVWMTGSPPSTVRFHLLNAGPDDSITLCMWFKTTQRKDVYKNGQYIESQNVRFLDGGGVLQTDGDFVPTRTDIGGANYFDKESRIMHLVIKGSDPVEIRTPPVVQISMSISVGLDEFFSIGRLINNIAFALGIDPSRIRVVRIVSEGSVQRFRRSLLETTAAPEENSTSTTNVTLEFGDPPAPNITMTSAPSVVEEIELAREVNDSVDVTENSVPESPLNGTNPLNVDSPSSAEGFVEQFNREALQFIEEASGYEVMLQEVMAANQLGEQLVNLVLTGEAETQANLTVTQLSVVPAALPPQPQPPVIPPDFQDVMSDPELVSVEDHVPSMPPLAVNSSGDGITFIIPSYMTVTKEPQEEVGHLVHVQVTIFDEDDEPVHNLGLVTPWMCQATLILDQPQPSPGSSPQLGGVTIVPFVRGVADFTRLRVDRPSQHLSIMFHTVPVRFQARTSVTFSVVAPPTNTNREKVGFVLQGDLGSIPPVQSAVLQAITDGLGTVLDVDLSRIVDLSYKVSSIGLVVEFSLLERHATDSPDVPTLTQAIADLQLKIRAGHFKIPIGNHNYTALEDSFMYVTPPPPPEVPKFKLPIVVIVIMSASMAGGLCLLLVSLAVCYRCVGRCKKDKKTRVKVAPCRQLDNSRAILPQRGHDCWSLPSESSFSDASWASLMSGSNPATPTLEQSSIVHSRLQLQSLQPNTNPHIRSGPRRPNANTNYLGPRSSDGPNSAAHICPTVPANFHPYSTANQGHPSHPSDQPTRPQHQQHRTNESRLSLAHLANSTGLEFVQESRRGANSSRLSVVNSHPRHIEVSKDRRNPNK